MYLFQQLNKLGKGMSFASTREAQQWYRDQAANINKKDVDPNKVMSTAGPFKLFTDIGGPSIGKMYMYFYDAKHKDTLPFFDMFPLVFPISFDHTGFLGLNLHYLPPVARAQLMNALYTIANNDKFNSSTRLQLSYEILKQSSTKFRGFENCIKRYLFGHVKSAFHYVNPADWDKALMLPMQRWHINSNPRYSMKQSPPY